MEYHKNNESKSNFDYTIVLDGDFAGMADNKAFQREDAVKPAAPEVPAPESRTTEPDSLSEKMDRLYYDYEKMCYKDPNTLDKDDIYPHSYQWRLGDRYDEGKVPVLEEAIRTGLRIAETEAYEKYVEEIRNRRFTPDSWD